MFKFTVSAGQRVAFDVDRSAGGALNSYLRIFDGSGKELAANDDGGAPDEPALNNTESYLEFTFAAAGVYYAGVSGSPNANYDAVTGNGDAAAASTGAFVLRLTSRPQTAPPDGNDQISEARVDRTGTTVRDQSVDTPTDVDMYRVTARAGQRLAFNVKAQPGSSGVRLDSYLRVFNAAGEQLAANDDAAAPGEPLSTSAYLEFTFAAAGSYWVGVSGSPNRAYNATTGAGDVAGSTGGYSLRISTV